MIRKKDLHSSGAGPSADGAACVEALRYVRLVPT